MSISTARASAVRTKVHLTFIQSRDYVSQSCQGTTSIRFVVQIWSVQLVIPASGSMRSSNLLAWGQKGVCQHKFLQTLNLLHKIKPQQYHKNDRKIIRGTPKLVFQPSCANVRCLQCSPRRTHSSWTPPSDSEPCRQIQKCTEATCNPVSAASGQCATTETVRLRIMSSHQAVGQA